MSRYIHIELTHNKKSASVILPKVLEIIQPKSVVDVGCGNGSFLSILKDRGVKEILGIEGDWLDRDNLLVDAEFIISVDLEAPFNYHKRFDLAICLEVVEHLKEESADIIVDSLTKLSDVILFSAAIPGQGGQNHINEQWVEYWEKKFSEMGYTFFDNIRMFFWNNIDVDYWYKQNMFFVVKNDKNNFGFKNKSEIKSVIHPELFSLIINQRDTLSLKYNKLAWGNESLKIYLRLVVKKIFKLVKVVK